MPAFFCVNNDNEQIGKAGKKAGKTKPSSRLRERVWVLINSAF
jgi:hypothetical protein